jgi:hypothetical protein
MAAVNTTRWSNLILKVGDGASPEVFTALCSINASRGLSFNTNLTEEAIPDCSDLEAVMWMIREKVSVGVEVTGGGKVDKANVKTFADWVVSKDVKRCQIVLHDAVAANVITFEGDFHLETFSMTGDPGSPTVSGEIALKSSGEVEGTYGANVGGS